MHSDLWAIASGTGWYNFWIVIVVMESINMALKVHKIHEPEQNLLVNQQWEVPYPILSCTNLEQLRIYFLSNPKELTVRFWVWESGLPLCIVPQVYHFNKLVIWCVEHYTSDSKSIVTEQLSQIFITISRESVIKCSVFTLQISLSRM